MICVKFTASCDLRIRLATLRKSVRKFWFCKLALTCESGTSVLFRQNLHNSKKISFGSRYMFLQIEMKSQPLTSLSN